MSGIGAAIKAYRRRAGLRQEDLAFRVNYSKSMVSKVEQGRRAPSVWFVDATAEALGVDVGQLTGKTP